MATYIPTTESCTFCEKVVVKVELQKPVVSPHELPNTYNAETGTYEWRPHESGAYALVPHITGGTSGTIDCYLCLDEDELDDIIVAEYAYRLVRDFTGAERKTLMNISPVSRSLSPPATMTCWKRRHLPEEEQR
jgi:hypothetical protein